MWRQDTTAAAEPRARISRAGLRWELADIVIQHLSRARVTEGPGVSWNTTNDTVLAEGQRLLISDPAHLDAVKVTVVIDLTPVRDGTGASRLLTMLEGHSKKTFTGWVADRDQSWRDGIEVVAMDDFTGLKTATSQELPEAVTVMEPFHVVHLAGDALNEYRRRVQQDLHDHHGRKDDPLHTTRRTLHTARRPAHRTPTPRPPHRPTMTMSNSKPPGASTNGSSPPTNTPTTPRPDP